jgi:hypothetical protein
VTSLYFGIIMYVSREQIELRTRQQISVNNSHNDIPTIDLD